MPVTFSPSALSEARRRLYGADAGQSTSRAAQLAKIERDAYEQQVRANKAAADAERKAIEDAAKQADDERKLANAQRTNELLAQGRRYHLDRVTGEPRPLQTDEEFAAAKADKARKAQEAQARKEQDAKEKAELDKVAADESVMRENEKSIQRNQQREELEREEKRRKLKGIQDEYEKRLKAADDLELDLTPEQRQATVGTIENVKKRLADLDTAKFEKQKESLKFDTAQDERGTLLRKREAAIKRGEAPTPSPEPLIADPVEFEQSAAQHQAEVDQLNAEQAQQQAKMAALEAENERLMSLPHSAADVSEDGKWHKDVIPAVQALNDVAQNRGPEWQAKQQRIQEQARVLDESAKAMNAQAQAANEQAKAEQIAAREAAYQDFEKVAPGMGKEYQAILDDSDKRAAALRTKYAGREDAPEAKAAFTALEADITGKLDGLQGRVDEVSTKKQTGLNSLYDKFAVANADRDHLYDWTAKTSTDTDAAKAKQQADDAAYAAKKGLPGYSYRAEIDKQLDEEAKRLGIDPKEARTYMETRRRLDWSKPLTGEAVEGGKELTRGLREAIGISKMLEPTRKLPDGSILANPILGGDEEAFKASIEAADGTLEQKAEALKQWPALRRNYGDSLLAVFAKQTAIGEDFNEWRETGKAKSTDPAEQALEYQEEMKGRSFLRRWGDVIASQVTSGFMDVTQAALGSTAAIAGKVPVFGEFVSELAAANAENASSLVNTLDQTSNTGATGKVVGSLARMTPGVLATIGTGSLAGGMIFGGAQTAGSLYGDAYGKLREDGLSHDEAWKASAPASIAAGAMTAGLTKLFPGGSTAILRSAEARQSVRTLMAGFMSGGMATVKSAAKGALDELPEEIIDEGVSQFAQAAAEGRDPQQAVRDFITGLPELMATAGIMGGGMQAFSDYRDRRAGGTPPAPAPEVPEAPTPDAGPLPEEKAAVQATIAAFNPTAPEAIQAMPAVIRTVPKGQESGINAKARAAMDAVAGIASGEITDPASLTETQMRALGVKLDKGGKLVSAGGANSPAPLIYTRPDKAGVDQIVITDEARDWIQGAVPDLAIGQSEAERIQAINTPKPKARTPRKPKAEKPVAETGPRNEAPAPEAAASEIDPGPITALTPTQEAVAEGSQMGKGALAPAGVPESTTDRPALGKAPPLQRKAIGKGMKGGSSYAEFATVDDADAFAYAAKLRAMGAKNVSPAKVKELGEAAKGIITRISARLGISEQEARPVFSAYNVAVRKQAKAVREGESFYAPTLAEFMQASQPQTDTKADIPAAETASTAGETAPTEVDTAPADFQEYELRQIEQANRDAAKKALNSNSKTAAIIVDGNGVTLQMGDRQRHPTQNTSLTATVTDDQLTTDERREAKRISQESDLAETNEERAENRAKLLSLVRRVFERVFGGSATTKTPAEQSKTPPAEVDTAPATGGELIKQAHSRMAAVVQSATAADKPKAIAAAKAVLDGLRRYNGHLPIVLTDDPAFDFAWGRREKALIINPETALARFVGDSTDPENAAAQARQFFRHELIHKFVVSQLGDARVMDIWGQLPKEVQDQVQKAYSVRLVARGQKPKKLNPDHGGHEYYRAMLEAMKDGTMTEQVIGKDLADKWRKFLDDVLSLLRDLKKQFASIESESARNNLIQQVDQDIKLVSDALDAFEKSISPDAEPAQVQNAGAVSTSGKPVEGSSTTVATPVSIKSEKESSGNDESEKPKALTRNDVSGRPFAKGESIAKVGFLRVDEASVLQRFYATKTPEEWPSAEFAPFSVWQENNYDTGEIITNLWSKARDIEEANAIIASKTSGGELLIERKTNGETGWTQTSAEIEAKKLNRKDSDREWVAVDGMGAYGRKRWVIEGTIKPKEAAIQPPEIKDGGASLDSAPQDEGDKALGDAFAGLFASPTSKPLAQADLPKDRRDAMMKAASVLVDVGVKSPAELAQRLDKLAPNGALRQYTRAFWRLMSGFDSTLEENPHWPTIYAELDQPAVSSRPPSVEGVTGPSSEQGAAPASAKSPPSLGTTGKEIWQGWKNQTGMEVMPDEVIVGVDVHNGGTFTWSGDELMRSETNAKQGYALMRPATKAEIEGLHDSIDRGGLQIEARKKTGATGMFPKVDGGKTAKVIHQATGKPLAEWLETPAGKKWLERDKETQRKVAEINARTDTPATAEAKVEEQVQTIAATEGQRDAKEIKKEIITKVEKAIKDIETGVNTSSEPMTFRIPGDGTFTLRHELGSLSEFIKRVKRISTKDSAAPEKVKEPKQEVTDYALEWGTEASFNTALDQLQEFVSANVEELQKNPNAIVPIERLTRFQDRRSRYTSSQKANISYSPSLAAAVKAWQATQGSKMPTWAELRDWLGVRVRQASQSAGIEWTPESPVEPAQEATPAEEAPKSPEVAAPAVEETALEVAAEVQPITGFDSARAFIAKLRKGEVTAEQVRTAWEQLKAQRPAILADLMKMKVDELLPMAGMSARKSDGKASVAESALGSLDFYFNPDDSISYSYGGDFQANKDAAMDEKVAKWTDEMIVEQAQARREAAEASKAAKEKALTNPETKEEWEKFIYRRGRQSLSDADVKRILKIRGQSARMQEVLERGEKLLTPEELARYDAVIGINRKEKAQDAAEAKARVYGVDANTETDIIETTHTKKGYPLFVVKLADRVERHVYDRLNIAAKKLGGYYSSYRGNGATPGFQFRSRAEAEQFQAASRGETIDRTEAIQERQGEKKNAAAERLMAQADKLEENADEVLNADRQTNTARRARMAASAENAAESNKAMARTMRNLAEAIASGKATHLDGVNTKAHVATLEGLARSGKDKAETAEGLSYADREKRKYEPATPEQMAFASYPYPYLHKSDVLSMVALGEKTPGAKLLAARVAKIRFTTNEGEQGYLTDAGQIEEFRELAQKLTERGKSLWDTYAWKFESYDRVRRMGLMDLPSLRAALREFTQFRSIKTRPDKLKEMERALIGQKLPGFFPTPRSVIDDMVASADIGEGMRVLEPSAGKGDIADAVREAGADVDVIERSGTLRDILTEKKFNIIGQDFMDETPSPIYDAVLMNPPFEDGAEMRHVRHAYDFLKPGGKLIAVMSEGPFGRSDKASADFREWLDTVGTSERLPQGTFASAEAFRQTGVSTRLVTIIKPAPLQASPSGFVGDTDVLQLPITDAEIMDAADNATETPEAILEAWAATADVVEESPKWKTVDGRTWLTEPEAKATGLVYYNIEPDEDGLNDPVTEEEWRNLQRGKVYDIEAEPLQASPTASRDAEYMAAVAAGDMEKAQKMVDEAAKGAGFNVGPVWHGSPDEEFTIFQKPERDADEDGFWFSKDREWASKFGPTRLFYIKNAKTWGGDDFVVKEPNSIKSADPVTRDDAGNVIPLSQRFNPESDSILYASPTVPKEPFYSKLAQVIEQKMPNRADVATIKGLITNPQTGIKAEELKWSGILPWIEAQASPITKQAVLDYLATDGAVRLEEVRMGDKITRILPDENGRYSAYAGNALVQSGLTMQQAEEMELRQPGGKFSQYQLPGGENYREVVLAMTETAGVKELSKAEALRQLQAGQPVTAKAVGEVYRGDEYDVNGPDDLKHFPTEGEERYRFYGTSSEKLNLYTSSHFPDVPNYVAHARLNDRTDAEGKPGTFIEEIQSDRHQAGRDKGYQLTDSEREREWQRIVAIPAEQRTQADVTLLDRLKDELRSGASRVRTGIPDAPFRSTWPLQMFKRALADAVAAGKQWIGWTTGATQSERYDMSKQVGDITAKLLPNGYILGADGGEIASGVPAEKLADYVGKEIAQKIINEEGEPLNNGNHWWYKATKPEGIRELGANVFGAKMAGLMPLDIVDGGVLTASNHNQVRQFIVSLLPVDVVDNLRAAKLSPNDLFSNQDVVFENLPVNRRDAVARGVVDAVRTAGTAIRAKLESGRTTRRDELLLPTLKASDLNSREVASLLSPESIFHSGAYTGEKATTSALPRAESSGLAGGQKLRPAELAAFLDLHASNYARNGEIVKQFEAPSGVKLSGDDLKIESAGMKGFYDTILPKEIGKYVKQWGAGVVKGDVGTSKLADWDVEVLDNGSWALLGGEYSNEAAAVDAGEATGKRYRIVEHFNATTTPIWRVDITPQMRTSVDAGQALFATPSGKEGDTGKKPRRTIDPATQGDTPTTESNRANPGDSPLNRRAAANARAKYEAEEMTQVKFDDLRSAVAKELERDFDGNLEDIEYKLADIELNGGGLSIEDQEKVRQLANKLSYRGRLEGDRMMREQADRLLISNASIGSELGRGLALRRDQFKTPQERLDDAMGNILAPSQTIIRERTINVKTKKERDAIITEIIKENDAKIDAILKRNGLTQTDLFLSVDDRFAMQEAILGLARVHLSQQSAAHKKAIEMSVRGYSDNAIAKETGLTVAEVSNTAEHFRNVVAKQLTAREVGKGNTFSKFIQWGKRIISEMDDALRATPSGKRRNLAEDLANTRAKKRNASAQEVAEAVRSILDTAIPTKSQRNSNWLHEATWTYGKKTQKVFVPYNAADWKQVYRVARELSTREATKLDKAYEYWINGILSGPQTHVVNTASNLLSTAWAYGPQWLAEATTNVAIRNPNAPQFGEFKHIWAGFYKGIMPALRNFALAWDTEADPVEHQYLNKPVTVMFQGGNLDKVGGIRPSLGGTLGRYVRMPGRLLVAQDAFAKTLIMHAESAAMAYRLGKKQGLTKTALENFIATQIATHGSESWQHAFEKAAELTFQDENDITKSVETVTNAFKRAKFVGFLFNYLLPFVRTPTNIYRAGIRKAGGSAGMLLYRLGKSGYYAIKGDTNEFRSYREGAMVKDVSESVMALAFWFIVMGMSEGDDDDNQKAIEITGSRPFGVANAGERASQVRQEGGSNLIIIRKNPFTGEKLDKPIQFAYGRYEPIALALSTLVDGAREFKKWTRFQPENRTTDMLAGSIMRHVLAQAKEKTFLQGISGIMQFYEDAGSKNFSAKELLMKNLMNGAIPNLIRQPYRLSQDEIADAKKAESELSRSLGIGQPKVNEAGQPVQRGGNAVTRVLFPVASKPSTELFDAALKKWNTTNPDQQWNPDPLTKADLYVYGPKVDGKMQQVPLKDPAKITKFEQEIGQKFADYSARKLMAAGWKPGKPVTPQMIDAIKEVRTNAIKSVRASMGREERFGTTTPATAPSTPPARPSPAPSMPVPSTAPPPVPMKDDAAERAKARLIEARKNLRYGGAK